MSVSVILLAVAAAQAVPAVNGHSVTITLAAPVGGTAYVTGHLLNCRTEPAQDARILTTIPHGLPVTVLRQNGEWQLLKLKTKSCWGSTRFLSTSKVKTAAEVD